MEPSPFPADVGFFWQREELNQLKPGELAKKKPHLPCFASLSRFLEFCNNEDKTSYVWQKEDKKAQKGFAKPPSAWEREPTGDLRVHKAAES